MPIKGTIIEPPDDMTEKAVREKAERLLAALKSMKGNESQQKPPGQHAQGQDAPKAEEEGDPPSEKDTGETLGDDDDATE